MKLPPHRSTLCLLATARLLATAHLLATTILVLISTTACGTMTPMPDLGSLYTKVAKHHDQHRNPVIVIPGILGTKLTDSRSGRTVWGAFGGKTATNPRQAEGARLFTLPMDEGKPLRELRDEVVPDGVLEKMKVRLMGLPIELKAYFQILLTLGAGGYRDEDLKIEGIDYGSGHFTCFQFDYDWRRDNVENARRFHGFVREKAAYVAEQRRQRWGESAPVKFDVIAHSMGGLLLRYYLRYGDADLPADGSLPKLTWAGAEKVENAVLIATPSSGAVDALVQLVNGRKFGPMTPLYEPAVMGTFPSVYQLLPRQRHAALMDPSNSSEALDLLDAAVWQEHGWGLADPQQAPVLQQLLPDANEKARRRVAIDHLEKSLTRARHFHAALDQPAEPPPSTKLYLMAGDAIPTARSAAFRNGKMEIVNEAPGDGTVLRSSALMDERLDGQWEPALRSPIAWTNVTFLRTDHLGITKDPAFTDNVLYLLLESPREKNPRP